MVQILIDSSTDLRDELYKIILMILINSDADDRSTDDVQDWLYYLKKSNCLHRSNGVQKLKDISISLNSKKKFNFKYNTDSGSIDSSSINAYWYRRGIDLVENSILSSDPRHNEQAGYKSVLKYLTEENMAVFDVLNELKNEVTTHIGNYKHNYTNKLVNLVQASKCGLLIPETLISNSKIEIMKFIDDNKKAIVKNITQSPFIQEHVSDTQLLNIDFENFVVDKSNAESVLNHSFDLTLFQKYIGKKLELRIFFINDTFFTAAIFSQASEKTKIDYRNYDKERPNRIVPFELPGYIKGKISNLMRLLNMNCGSIDMIYSTNNKFYFLEVNPIGQFQGNEKECNFNISKTIASILLKTSI